MMPSVIYLGGDDDMRWLRTTHWPSLPTDARCALLHGNEDAPDKIEAWACDQPRHNQPPDYTCTLLHTTDKLNMGE